MRKNGVAMFRSALPCLYSKIQNLFKYQLFYVNIMPAPEASVRTAGYSTVLYTAVQYNRFYFYVWAGIYRGEILFNKQISMSCTILLVILK